MIKQLFFLALLALFAISGSAAIVKDEVPVSLEFALTDDIPLTPGQAQADIHAPGRTFSYFYYDMPANSNIRNIVVSMVRTDNESDPDLYIKVGDKPNRNSYDAADTSTNNVHNVEIDIQPQEKRIWIGVYTFSTEDAIITLTLDVYQCGNKNCGGDKQGTCAPDTGVCTCKTGFIGNNCQHAIVQGAEFDQNYSATIGSYETVFFNYTANVKLHGYLKSVVTRTDSTGLMTVLVAHNRIPTPDDNDGMTYAYNSQSEAVLNINENAMASGNWILGVSMSSRVSTPITVAVASHLSFCINDCSGHGVCNEETSTCTCDVGYVGSPDCSVFSTPLHKDDPLAVTLEPFTYLHFTIPLNDRYAAGPIEMSIKFTTTNKDVLDFPVMYLKRDGLPTSKKFDVTSPVPATADQTLFVPAHDLSAGNYHLMIDNLAAESVEGTLTVTLTPHCPNNCNGLGTCNEFGDCVCKNGHLGGDCSTDAKACREHFDLPHGGFGVGTTVFIIFLFTAIGGGVGVFLFKKYGNAWFAPRERSNPDLQYNQLN